MTRRFWFICIALGLLFWQGFGQTMPAAFAGTSTLKVTRLHIYFGNYRSEITVPQNKSTLTAYVELDYEGIGLLQGHWEVDGQVLSHVRRHLDRSNDGSIVLTSPQVPGLPTWQIGGHRVSFILNEPALGQPEPVALYFVTAKQVIAKGVNLTSPAHQASLALKPQLFSWSAEEQNNGYLLTFFDEPGNTVFSVYTKEQEYRLPEFTLGRVFQRGNLYQWQVWGYDEDLNKQSGSVKQQFFIKP